MDVTDIFPFASDIGYLGLSLVSFFGSLVPFVPLPSFLLLATMAVGDQFNLHIIALSSALLSTIAKQIIFYVSYGGRKLISKKSRQRMLPFQKLVKKYGASAVFVAAATPMPDDLVYIPLGLAKYDPKRFFIATLSGKIILHYIIVIISHFLGLSLIEPFLENIDTPAPIYIGIAAFGVIMTLLIILVLKLDWAKILGKFAPWTLDEDKP